MSHAASAWAFRATEVPLDARMLLCYLADMHCPENGCLAEPSRLAEHMGVDVDLTVRLLVSLERRGMILRTGNGDRILLAFEVFPETKRGAA